MSQFLLVQAEHPSTGFAGLAFRPANEDPLLASASRETFGAGAAWSVTDLSGGADSLADAAREALLAGNPLKDTLLGSFLLEQVRYGRSLCLFWGSDFVELPQPTSVEELLELVAEQLGSDGASNWELYAHWQGASAGTAGSA